jgi:phosphatidylserine decarboxylase
MALSFLLGVVALAALLIYWRFIHFFRDPERASPPGRNVVAPADGVVVYAREYTSGLVPVAVKGDKAIPLVEILKSAPAHDSGFIVGIYLSPWDVHVNRAPIRGRVESVHYHRGGRNRSMARFGTEFLATGRAAPNSMRHVVENERNTIHLRGDLEVYVVQIADWYIRKISCWTREGQEVEKGERIGMIRMGSQVDLVLPRAEGLSLRVKEGERARGGETVIAVY